MGWKLVYNYKDYFKNGIYSKIIEIKIKYMEVNYVYLKVVKVIIIQIVLLICFFGLFGFIFIFLCDYYIFISYYLYGNKYLLEEMFLQMMNIK